MTSVPVSIGRKATPATRPVAGSFGDNIFVQDWSRCIGCRACVQACEECGTHRGRTMIHLDEVDAAASTQTVPMVCMHCEDPTCAEVCPADAIKQNEDGVVQSSLKPRCIGCSNCVLACPFGVPKYESAFDQMMKCDMCYDRTSIGLKPMCASVCPSDALWFGTPEEFAATRTGTLVNEFRFGNQYVATKVRTVAHEPGPVDIAGAAGYRPWQDDPFGLDEPGGSAWTRGAADVGPPRDPGPPAAGSETGAVDSSGGDAARRAGATRPDDEVRPPGEAGEVPPPGEAGEVPPPGEAGEVPPDGPARRPGGEGTP